MAFPLVPVALAGLAAWVLFGKKSGAAVTPPGASPYAPPSSPSSPYVPPSGGGGGGYSPPSGDGGLTPGQIDPATGTTYIGPGGGGSYTPLSDTGAPVYDPSQGAYNLGPAASATGTNADQSLFDQAAGLFSTSGVALVWCDQVGGWCPYYAGHELGYPPPAGTPIFDQG